MSLLARIGGADIPFKNDLIKGDLGDFCSIATDSPFLEKAYFCQNVSVPVSKIVGSGHPNYRIGIAWGEFLEKGERITSAIRQVDANPEYYYSKENKDHFSFLRIGDEYYITAGNHRAVLAKFLFFLDGRYDENVFGADVTECIIDHESKGLIDLLHEAIKKANMTNEIGVNVTRYEAKKGTDKSYTIYQYQTTLKVVNTNRPEHSVLIENLSSRKSKDLVKSLIQAFDERKWWSPYFSSNLYAKFVG